MREKSKRKCVTYAKAVLKETSLDEEMRGVRIFFLWKRIEEDDDDGCDDDDVEDDVAGGSAAKNEKKVGK